MQRILHTLRTQWLGALGLLIGLTGVAFGATGKPAILGQSNQANAPTSLQNTANGPAAAFVTRASQPPFTVTSGQQVPNLNASKLGGRPPAAYARIGASFQKAASDARYAPRTGSTAYLSSAAPQLLAVRRAAGSEFDPGVASPIFDRSVTAPAEGILLVRFAGQCTASGAPGTFALGVSTIESGVRSPTMGGGASSRSITVTPGDAAEKCNIYLSEPVSDAQRMRVVVSVTNGTPGGTGINADGVVEVVFQPD